MAISVTSVGTAFNSSATSLSLTPTGAVPSNALLYVGGADRASSTVARTVTDGASNSYTRAAFAYLNNLSSVGSAQVSYVENCAAVSTSQTITYTCPVAAPLVMAAAYATGVQTSSSLDVTGIAFGSASPISGVSPAPTVSGDLVVAFAGLRSGNTAITADATWSSWTSGAGDIVPNIPGAVSAVAQYYVETLTGTKSYSASLASGNSWALIFASFKAATGSTSVSVTGVSATGGVGTATANFSGSTSVTGVSATGGVGTATANFSGSTSVTGVSATGGVGTTTVDISGSATVPVTGVSATGDVGSVTVGITGDISVSVTGVSTSGEVGTVTVTAAGSISVSVTGVSASGIVGDAVVSISVSVSVTGVEASSSVGTVSISVRAEVSITGVSATGEVGTASITVPATVSVEGVYATGYVGQVLVWGLITPDQDPFWTPIAA